jgi:hypothetical protein
MSDYARSSGRTSELCVGEDLNESVLVQFEAQACGAEEIHENSQ